LQIDELDKNIKVFNKGQRYGFLKNKAELLFPRLRICLKLWFLTFRGAMGEGRWAMGRWVERWRSSDFPACWRSQAGVFRLRSSDFRLPTYIQL